MGQVDMLQNFNWKFHFFLTGVALESISEQNEKCYRAGSKNIYQFITQTKAVLLMFLQNWHVILHKFNVPFINLCKHTNKCPIFPECTCTFPLTVLINIQDGPIYPNFSLIAVMTEYIVKCSFSIVLSFVKFFIYFFSFNHLITKRVREYSHCPIKSDMLRLTIRD